MTSNRSGGRQPLSILLLLTARSYRAISFINAAETLGVEVLKAFDMHQQLADYWDYALGLDYDDLKLSVAKIVAFATHTPIGAIIAVDDTGSILASYASMALGLPHNRPEAAMAARDKFRMRQLLARSSVQSPKARQHYFEPDDDRANIEKLANELTYPCVVKPLDLNGSRGVIRVDNSSDFLVAAKRLKNMLEPYHRDAEPIPYIIEQYVPGIEVALEGIMDRGSLMVLALFDKPDPLEGPYFEETIYVTPSRLAQEIQEAIYKSTADATAALGLFEGPIHAELRVNESGPWIIEIAGRSIGGLCSKTLRFGTSTSLEELIIKKALGMEISTYERDKQANGVMMIPIPEAGLLKKVIGCEEAEAVPLIESVEITVGLNQPVTPLPEGDSYLGFIFARGDAPADVEAALREAHSRLRFVIAPHIAYIPM